MPVFDDRMPARLREGVPLMGIFIGPPSPAIVEMAGHAGYDFVILDNEHGPSGLETTEHLIRAARCAGTIPIVRVSNANTQEILRTLDIGAAGVQVPQVNTVEQARTVVAAAKYPPLGVRGVAFSTRAAGYGFFGGEGHVKASNEGTVVITHIETVEAVGNLDGMLEVEGIDVMFIGPTDLSVSMGYPGNPGHPEVQATIRDCIHRITATGRTAGLMVGSPQEFHQFAEAGARYITFNITGIVGAAMKANVGGCKSV
jgi:4-hydroxy-2-oxoheptanedioate aldolase